MLAIEISGLKKTYQVGFLRKTEKTALKGLSLQVELGEVFGCLGPNGAGKTTTLKLLMGLIFPAAGWAKILGMDAQDPRVKAQIGFLPEQPYFYDYLTAAELLGYYAQLSGVPAEIRRPRVAAMLEKVGLAEVANTQLRKFSKGMLQRVGIAQAIVHDPKIVFLDEPMSGLDPIGRREVRELIQSLKDDGKTIFFSTHVLSDAETLCDRVAVLNKGELKAVGVVADLVSQAHGKVELVWNGPAAIAALAASGTSCRVAGKTVRATIPESELNSALDALRSAQATLISVNPVQNTLEDFFLRHLQEAASNDGAVQSEVLP
jgi:ABC-2 type transport system ATP-binding protein